MLSPQSGLDAFLFGIPAVGILFAGFFRIDGIFSSPRWKSSLGRPLSHRGENGQVICIEPDGRVCFEADREQAGQRRANPVRRRPAANAVQKVFVTWAEEDPGE